MLFHCCLEGRLPTQLGILPFRVYTCLAWNSGFTALITSFEYHISWRSSVHFSEPPHCACGKRSPAILQAMILQLASAHFDLWWRTATNIHGGQNNVINHPWLGMVYFYHPYIYGKSLGMVNIALFSNTREIFNWDGSSQVVSKVLQAPYVVQNWSENHDLSRFVHVSSYIWYIYIYMCMYVDIYIYNILSKYHVIHSV